MKSIVNKLGEVASTVRDRVVSATQYVAKKPVQTAVALAAAYGLSGCAPTIVYQDRLVPYAVPTPVPAQVQSNQAKIGVIGDGNTVIIDQNGEQYLIKPFCPKETGRDTTKAPPGDGAHLD